MWECVCVEGHGQMKTMESFDEPCIMPVYTTMKTDKYVILNTSVLNKYPSYRTAFVSNEYSQWKGRYVFSFILLSVNQVYF